MQLLLNRYSCKKWTHIIIHHSWSEDDNLSSQWSDINRYHVKEKGWTDVAYNFGIENVSGAPTLCMGRSLTMQGAHTIGMNDVAIGICLIGNFDLIEPTDEQYQALANLCAYLCKEFNIPIANIEPHNKYADKTCPGKLFDFNKLLERVYASKDNSGLYIIFHE